MSVVKPALNDAVSECQTSASDPHGAGLDNPSKIFLLLGFETNKL
jgi:hypothetical protein